MFTKVCETRFFAGACKEKEAQEARSSTYAKFVLLEDGRLVPVEPGGMVEVALNELGAKIVEVEIPSVEKVDQEE
jgi:hypothetical protein